MQCAAQPKASRRCEEKDVKEEEVGEEEEEEAKDREPSPGACQLPALVDGGQSLATSPTDHRQSSDLRLPPIAPASGADRGRESDSRGGILAAKASAVTDVRETGRQEHKEEEEEKELEGEEKELEGEEKEKEIEGGEEEEEDQEISLDQLPQIDIPLNCSSDEHTSEEDEGDKEEEDGEDEEGDETDTTQEPPPYPNLHAEQVSWPAVLQYLRESDSLSSHYFSLGREQRVEGEGGTEGAGEGEVCSECQFCGHTPPQWSILNCASEGEEVSRRRWRRRRVGYRGGGYLQSLHSLPQALPVPCCPQFREYCVLVIACHRQMVVRQTDQGTHMIPLGLKREKKNLTKTAEEKAFAL